MSYSVIGLFVGLLLAVAGAAGGFAGFLFALVLGFVGFVLGGQADGRIDISEIFKSRRG